VNPRRVAAAALALTAYVTLSSVLGLSGARAWPAGDLARLVAQVWRTDALADVAFALGTLCTGFLAYRLAREHRVVTSLFTSVVGTGVTYVVSYALLVAATTTGPRPLGDLVFPLQYGWLGLAFGILSPAVVARPWSRETPRTAPPAGA